MVIVAHWVDKEFKLQKRIINFCQVIDHKGESIGKEIEVCLKDWGIGKLFGITVDNASSNDKVVQYLKMKFQEKKGGLILEEKYLHMRCCAHIVNLIVNEGLKERHHSIQSIRNAVRYVRSSPARLNKFKECVNEEEISYQGLLCLDVPTRWNSTYLMLDTAIKFAKAFDKMTEYANYLKYFEEKEKDGTKRDGPPCDLDWENAKVFVRFLQTFYDVTMKFSGSTYVTSNKYFTEISGIQDELLLLASGIDSSPSHKEGLLEDMARGMKKKYDKY